MKELSIFVDESGDFGLEDLHSPYYIVTMVFHDQGVDISNNLKTLDDALRNLGYENQAVHTEPLIRREHPYQNYLPNDRRSIFTKLFFFAQKIDIQYKTFIFHKKEFADIYKLEARMSRDMSRFLRDNLSYFQSFDNIILYYDNGQQNLSRILNTVLATELSEYEVRKVLPSNYRLLQVADLICTIELTQEKISCGMPLSKSEEYIFFSIRDFKKDFLRGIRKKTFSSDI